MSANLPIIVKAVVHYGFPTVWVEPFETTDQRGNRVMVDHWYQNGCLISSQSRKFRKDGSLGYGMGSTVTAPQNVRDALDAMKEA